MIERPKIIDVVRKPRKCPVCGERVVDIIYGTGDMTEIEFLLEYTISGMIAVYQRWFNTGRKQDIEELSRNLSILTFKGINGLSGK